MKFKNGLSNMLNIKKILRRIKLTNSKTAYIELSNICNAKCIFCPYLTIEESGKKLTTMDNGIFEKSIDYAVKLGYEKFSFTPVTGEIFINKNWAEYIRNALLNGKVRRIYFYSNAILLNSENIEKILSLPNKDKILFLGFSLGGIEKDTYKRMFGVDKFNIVRKNINNFCRDLKKQKQRIRINCVLYVPKDYQYTKKVVSSIFNRAKYKYFNVVIPRPFLSFPGIKRYNNLDYRNAKEKNEPCSCLKNIRFATNGDVWLCGCVTSELPNDESLKIGAISDKIDVITENKNNILRNWKLKKIIPLACQKCTKYVPEK